MSAAKHFTRVVLHVGTERTGTTSIQRTLATNRAALADRGILYPATLGRGDVHEYLIAYAQSPGDAIGAVTRSYRDFGGDWQALRDATVARVEQEAATRKSWHTLVLSNEFLHSRLERRKENRKSRNL